jgi:hypothetical protein
MQLLLIGCSEGGDKPTAAEVRDGEKILWN